MGDVAMMSTSLVDVRDSAAAAPAASSTASAEQRAHQKTPKKAKTAKDRRNAAAGANQRDAARKGANGVKLKKYEAVMCYVFATSPGSNDVCQEALDRLTPRYSQLPPVLDDCARVELLENAKRYWKERGLASGDIDINIQSPWPFDKCTSLPQCGQVRGASSSKDAANVGDVRNDKRALRKEMQLSNLIRCVLALLPDEVRQPKGENGQRQFRIVDFAGGTGHLAVPLALLLPHCEVVCVDLKKWSLDLLLRRVDGALDEGDIGENEEKKSYKQPVQSGTIQTSATLSNLSAYHGTIQTYPLDFDIGVSLHACGEASDWVLRKCLEQKASFVVCSCCCGKLRQSAKNPYVYQSTGGNEKEINYPQSRAFASSGRCIEIRNDDGKGEKQHLSSEMFDEIARAADYSELGDLRKPKNACRRAAKSLVEWDRLLYCKECMTADSGTEGNVVLTRMHPWEASPKNDILVGWHGAASNPYARCLPDSPGTVPDDFTCDADFQVSLRHLFGENGTVATAQFTAAMGQNDWTAQEEAEVRSQIETFLIEAKVESYKFPTGMGPRRRKLVHYVAGTMGLRHWGEGKRDSEKRVAVAMEQKRQEPVATE
ncbi:hypothetical protein ACHAXT_011221 [Thalassiosira profunda]